MAVKISDRMRNVQTPVIPVVQDLIKDNPGTISLGQGVVNYPPPKQVLQAVNYFKRSSELHKYQYVEGVANLRDKIATKLECENAANLTGRSIVVTAGSNMGFLNAVLAIADPGDEFILVKPYFFNHQMAITMFGCNTVTVDANANNQPVIGDIAQAISHKTRAVVTVSPNNPSGAVYSEALLRGVSRLCCENGLYHISDEAYEYFVYDDCVHYSPCAFDDAKENTIGLFSFSKSYGFASWRIGYMVIPQALSESIRKIQDTNLICPPVVSQLAAVKALDIGREYCKSHIFKLEEVRAGIDDQLLQLGDQIRVPKTEGAFYFLINVDTSMTSMQLVTRLIQEFGVAVIPGSTFGLNNEICTVRIAYAALNKDSVMEAISRLVRGIRCIT